MKALRRIPLLCLLFLITGSLTGTGRAKAQPGVSVSFQVFYDELAPYGRWMDYRGYGRVWIPRVEAGFQPYGSRGHWVVTEYGNTWVSDYDWGWAPFHYGRWVFDDYYGWIWVPGSDWGPAWVSWRSGGGYYGWAPLGPGMDINININIPLLRWIFVPEVYITHRSVYSYCVPRTRQVNIYRSTTVINNIYVNNNRRYFYGPGRNDIERATRNRVVVHHIDYQDRPGRTYASNNSVRVYRPDRDRNSGSRNDWQQNNNRDRSAGPSERPDYSRGDRGSRQPGQNNDRGWDRPDRDRNNGVAERNDRSQERNNSVAERNDSNPERNNRTPENNGDRDRNDQNPYWNRQRPQSTDGSATPGQRSPEERRQRNETPVQRPESRSSETPGGNSSRREEQRQWSAPEQRQQRPERSNPSNEGRSRERSTPSGERPSRGGRQMRG